jgi:sulfatase modifying factor 1
MKWLFAALVAVAINAEAETITFGTGANQFDIEFVPIGALGNPSGSISGGRLAGSVGYEYSMGRHEISLGMIEKANGLGGLSLSYAFEQNNGGLRSSIAARGISFTEAALFVNLLNTLQGYSPAYKILGGGGSAVTAPDVWRPGETGYSAANPIRNSGAKYFIPTVDEWFKAGWYDPNKNGVGGYWNFAYGSDLDPQDAFYVGTSAPRALIFGHTYVSSVYDAGASSPFGTMGQMANAWEIMEMGFDPQTGELKTIINGGGVGSGAPYNHFASWGIDNIFGMDLNEENSTVGFRVAMIPEPSTFSLALVGAALVLGSRRRL